MSGSTLHLSPPLGPPGVRFAGGMMIIGGGFQLLQAIPAIVRDQHLIVLTNYVDAVDLTVWCWVHLYLGLALVAIGIFLLRDQGWARIAGFVVAGLATLVNFSWLVIR